jgi:hypothetical protein
MRMIIITLAPARSQQSYRHEAFLWHDASDFTAGIVPFIRDGLEAREPVMVAVGALHTKWLRDALDGQADVEFVDMEQLGRNPAQIIPAWQQFLNTGSGRFRPVRGVGEPIWPGRRPEELVECQLHEAMLNIAIDPDTPFWLICPYDAVTLSPAVVEEAHRSHRSSSTPGPTTAAPTTSDARTSTRCSQPSFLSWSGRRSQPYSPPTT